MTKDLNRRSKVRALPLRLVFRFGFFILGALLLGSCANSQMGALGSAVFGDILGNVFSVPTAQLQAQIAKAFPVQTKVMQLLDAQVSNPIIRPLPETNQLEAGLDVSVGKSIFGNALSGSLRLASGLRFEAQDGSVRLQNTSVNAVQINGLPAQYNQALGQIGRFVVERVLNDYPVYKIPPSMQPVASALMQNAQIKVTPSGMTLAFQPATSAPNSGQQRPY